MQNAYDRTLLETGANIAQEMGISDAIHKGIYTCLGGPSYETVAELRMLRMAGVDAVGTFHNKNVPFFRPFLYSSNLLC